MSFPIYGKITLANRYVYFWYFQVYSNQHFLNIYLSVQHHYFLLYIYVVCALTKQKPSKPQAVHFIVGV